MSPRGVGVGGAVGGRRQCGSGWVVFRLVVARDGRVLREVDFFGFLYSDMCGLEESEAGKKRKEITFKLTYCSFQEGRRGGKRKETVFKL